LISAGKPSAKSDSKCNTVSKLAVLKASPRGGWKQGYGSNVESAARANPKLTPLEQLQAPVIDSAKLNSSKVTDRMTRAGLL